MIVLFDISFIIGLGWFFVKKKGCNGFIDFYCLYMWYGRSGFVWILGMVMMCYLSKYG